MLNLHLITHWYTITNPEGDVVLSSSAGKLGFKGSRKGTPFAASQVACYSFKRYASYGY